MSFLDSLFQGSPPADATTTSSSTSSLPTWYEQYLGNMMNMAQQQAAQPYQPYTGQMTAGTSPLQQQGFDQISQNANAWQPAMNQAQQMTMQGANSNPNGVQDWMNPYNRNVTDAIQEMGMRNLNENLNPALQNTFISSGQFGSGVDQDKTSNLIRGVGRDISNQQAGVLNQGYNSAMSNYLTSQNQQLAGGNQMGALAQMQNQGNINSANALQGAGQTQQNTEQAGLNAGYQNYQNQQQYPWQQIGGLHGALTGVQMPTTTTATQTGPFQGSQSPSPLATAGGLLGIGGAMGMFSDRRLKSNIKRIGTHPLGIGIYEYDIFDEHEIGVIADEVETVAPWAVMTHPSGYKMVDYSYLNG